MFLLSAGYFAERFLIRLAVACYAPKDSFGIQFVAGVCANAKSMGGPFACNCITRLAFSHFRPARSNMCGA